MPSSATRVGQLLADLARGLSQLNLRWYVFGAQAAIVHGAGRLTADVDVTVDLGRLPVARLLATLKPLGFVPQIPDPSFIEIAQVIPLIHPRTAIPVDLVLAGPGLEDLFFERMQTMKVGSAKVNFASPEDLISMKILSGRPKDIEDVETLLAVRRSDLNLQTVRNTLQLAEALLDQSDLLPVFERLLAHVTGGSSKRARSAATAKPPSRKRAPEPKRRPKRRP